MINLERNGMEAKIVVIHNFYLYSKEPNPKSKCKMSEANYGGQPPNMGNLIFAEK